MRNVFPMAGVIALLACNGAGDDEGGSGEGGSGSSMGGGPSGAPSRDPSGDPPETSDEVFGEVFSGEYHLGPVDFAESQWHNACAPGGGYRSELRDPTGLGGEFLAGVSNDHA